jgi:acetyl-CoA acyltransferase
MEIRHPEFNFFISLKSVGKEMNTFSGVGLIAAGAYEVVVAGGVEFMSDVPIRLSRKLRSVLLRSNKAKTLLQKIQLFSTVRPSYLALEVSCFRMITCNTFLIHCEGN